MLTDFAIGLFAANALPHYLFGRMNSGILGLFGYGAVANICYSVFCLGISLSLFHWKYNLATITDHLMVVGIWTVVLLYYIGWEIIQRYLRRVETPEK